MTKITPDDVVKAGYCIRGFRRLYEQWGLDRDEFMNFSKIGIDAERVRPIDDKRVQDVIRQAESREASGGQGK